MQKSSHAAVDWFPISTAECIGLLLNQKTNDNKAGAIGLVSEKYDEKYDDQIRSAANMESQSAAASDLIFTSLTRMTARLICVLAAIFNLRFLSH